MLEYAIVLCILNHPGGASCQVQSSFESYIYARGPNWAEQRCEALVSQFNARDIDNKNVEWKCVQSATSDDQDDNQDDDN